MAKLRFLYEIYAPVIDVYKRKYIKRLFGNFDIHKRKFVYISVDFRRLNFLKVDNPSLFQQRW